MWSTLVSNPRRGTQVLGLFILTVGVGALALPSLGRMEGRGVGILELELMRTSSKAAEVMARLGDDGVDAARTSIYLDVPFLIVYGVLLSAACMVVAARAAERNARSLAAAGPMVAWCAVAAAGFDAVENVALLVVLNGTMDQPWPGIAFWFACAKFALLALAIIYLVVVTIVLFRRTPAPPAP